MSKDDLDRKKQLTPKIKPMLAIFDPIELPTAISGVLFKIDEMVTKTSGIDVPNAIMVIPKNISLKPSFEPSFEVFETNNSAPMTKNVSPAKRVTIFNNIFIN